jgi:hypothetical protein
MRAPAATMALVAPAIAAPREKTTSLVRIRLAIVRRRRRPLDNPLAERGFPFAIVGPAVT